MKVHHNLDSHTRNGGFIASLAGFHCNNVSIIFHNETSIRSISAGKYYQHSVGSPILIDLIPSGSQDAEMAGDAVIHERLLDRTQCLNHNIRCFRTVLCRLYELFSRLTSFRCELPV